jgi:hypothetical protein
MSWAGKKAVISRGEAALFEGEKDKDFGACPPFVGAAVADFPQVLRRGTVAVMQQGASECRRVAESEQNR